jgi:two-component system cell cycle response regulator
LSKSSGTSPRSQQALSVLLVDSDPAFLEWSCKRIAEFGHRAWGAEDLLAAANFLADQSPDVMAIELPLLETDGADPLGDLQAQAQAALTILMGAGPPTERFREYCTSHEIYGYHDKRHGTDGLRLWVNAAAGSIRQIIKIQNTRAEVRRLLDAVPDLHKIQPLDELIGVILEQLEELVGGESGFVAPRVSDPVGKPPIEGFSSSPPTLDDYVVGATSADGFPRGKTVDQLRGVPPRLIGRAVEERGAIIDEHHGVLPLVLAEHVLGLAYLKRPALRERDIQLLQLFTNQAAAAIRNAALYELATVDATTRVFQKSFTLDRLRETTKLAWRRAFPVSVLMIDIDHFKKLNDDLGHVVGDRALRHIGHLLKSNVRDSDVVGRFGGDEFLVVLIDANDEGADIVADRLHEALITERGRPWPGGVPPLGTSMGMATLDPGTVPPRELGLPDFDAAVEALVAEADTAMYRARREARGMAAGRTLTWSDFLTH